MTCLCNPLLYISRNIIINISILYFWLLYYFINTTINLLQFSNLIYIMIYIITDQILSHLLYWYYLQHELHTLNPFLLFFRFRYFLSSFYINTLYVFSKGLTVYVVFFREQLQNTVNWVTPLYTETDRIG